MDSERDNLLRRLTAALQEGRAASIDGLLEGLHATDLLGEMSPEEQSDFLHQVGSDRAFRIMDEMPSDEAADFLGDR